MFRYAFLDVFPGGRLFKWKYSFLNVSLRGGWLPSQSLNWIWRGGGVFYKRKDSCSDSNKFWIIPYQQFLWSNLESPCWEIPIFGRVTIFNAKNGEIYPHRANSLSNGRFRKCILSGGILMFKYQSQPQQHKKTNKKQLEPFWKILRFCSCTVWSV